MKLRWTDEHIGEHFTEESFKPNLDDLSIEVLVYNGSVEATPGKVVRVDHSTEPNGKASMRIFVDASIQKVVN